MSFVFGKVEHGFATRLPVGGVIVADDGPFDFRGDIARALVVLALFQSQRQQRASIWLQVAALVKDFLNVWLSLPPLSSSA